MKMLLTLALRNLARHRARTFMTWFAIVIGVMGVMLSGGFVRDVLFQLGEAFINSQTGHLQIATPAYFESSNRFAGESLLKDSKQLAERLRARPHVSEVMGRLAFSGVINNQRRDYSVLIQGIEPGPESRTGNFLQILKGRALKEDDRFGALIGEGLAQSMDLHPGDQVVLLANTPDGALNTIDFDVVGVFRSIAKDFDARAVRIPLAAAQELLVTPSVNVLVVRLDHTASTAVAAADIKAQLAGTPLALRQWQQLSDFYSKAVMLYDRQFGVLQIIIFVMVILSVANSVNMSSFERTAEFGTMRAIGTPSGHVAKLLIVENILLGIIGATCGVLIGYLAALLISHIGIQMPPPPNTNIGYVAQIRVTPLGAVSAWLIGTLATALAAVLPARRAARGDICEALRHAL